MATKVKICGLRSEAEIDVAIAGGADYVGLVLFAPSPRHLSCAEARRLARHVAGRCQIVALTVDADDALIARINSDVEPDIFQLHGSESPERIRAIAAMTGRRTMKALKVATRADVAEFDDYYGIADDILFDAKAPQGSPIPGGNGLTFDWHILQGISTRFDYMLSGGLSADNVAAAVALTGAAAVDVSSGVESQPGRKDPVRIRAFLQAAKGL